MAEGGTKLYPYEIYFSDIQKINDKLYLALSSWKCNAEKCAVKYQIPQATALL